MPPRAESLTRRSGGSSRLAVVHRALAEPPFNLCCVRTFVALMVSLRRRCVVGASRCPLARATVFVLAVDVDED